MNGRRFEHPGKNRFWEIYWDLDEIEMCSGTIGTKGRMSQPRGDGGVQRVVESEIAKKLKEGFVEVPRELPGQAPQAPRAPEWIARIAEAYDDDGPRLVYADWLQGQGDPLGEFIMLQCERARLDRWDPKQKAMREREEHMLALYRSRWLPDPTANALWVRGFIERIRVSFPFDRTAFAAVLAMAPLARSIEISPETNFSDMPPEALAQLELGQFTGLFIKSFRWNQWRVEDLLDDDRLTAINRLGLAGCGLAGGDLKAIEQRAFRALDLRTNALGARGVQYALASAHTLVELELSNAGIGDPGAAAIADTALPKLERLWLRLNRLTYRSLARFAKLPSLRVLDLAQNQLGPAAIEALGKAPLPALRELDLSGCTVTDDMVRAFAASPLIKQLAWLDLGHNALGAAAAKALASAELPALRFLDLSSTKVGDEVAQVKAAHPHARIAARSR